MRHAAMVRGGDRGQVPQRASPGGGERRRLGLPSTQEGGGLDFALHLPCSRFTKLTTECEPAPFGEQRLVCERSHSVTWLAHSPAQLGVRLDSRQVGAGGGKKESKRLLGPLETYDERQIRVATVSASGGSRYLEGWSVSFPIAAEAWQRKKKKVAVHWAWCRSNVI